MEGGDIDPERLDEKENPFRPDDTGDDDVGESIQMTSTSARDTTYPFHYQAAEVEETSFIDASTPLIDPKAKAEAMERNMEEAWVRNHQKFPNANPKNSTFTASLDDHGHDKLPQKITKRLGSPAEEVIMDKEGVI